jgi:hypothetical protein
VALELALVAFSARQGWLPAKLRAYGWVAANAGHLWRRRRMLRAELAVSDRVWMRRLTDRLESTAIGLPALVGPLNTVMHGYWRLVRHLV